MPTPPRPNPRTKSPICSTEENAKDLLSFFSPKRSIAGTTSDKIPVTIKIDA